MAMMGGSWYDHATRYCIHRHCMHMTIAYFVMTRNVCYEVTKYHILSSRTLPTLTFMSNTSCTLHVTFHSRRGTNML